MLALDCVYSAEWIWAGFLATRRKKDFREGPPRRLLSAQRLDADWRSAWRYCDQAHLRQQAVLQPGAPASWEPERKHPRRNR
jgi:hypothetical protein